MNTVPLLSAAIIGTLMMTLIRPPARIGAQAQGPMIVFDTTLHDFGTIPFGGDGRCSFRFTNAGDAPLIIESVRSSCGCLVPAWDQEPVPPGSSGTVRLQYDTRRMGAFTKSVTLTCNAMNSPVLVLRIKGMVSPDPKLPQER